MKRLTHLILFACLVSLFSNLGFSQPSKEYQDEIEQTRRILQQQRIEVIRQALPLTPSEAGRFWPLYEKYQAEIVKIGDRKIQLITLYADNFEKLTDQMADYIVLEHFAIVKTKNDLQMSYFPKFKEVLPVIKAARFFQIENKVDALNDSDLARKVPLFDKPE